MAYEHVDFTEEDFGPPDGTVEFYLTEQEVIILKIVLAKAWQAEPMKNKEYVAELIRLFNKFNQKGFREVQ